MTVTDVVPERQVRAQFNERSVTVYQAYSPEIAEPALSAGTFVPPFKVARMTWIKPSFLWMMYRSGWATKPSQERVLAVQISREGFERALAHSALSGFESATYTTYGAWAERVRTSPVRIQWDPERSLALEPLPWRAIQIGLSGEAVEQYVTEWVVGIDDVTPMVHQIRDLIAAREHNKARAIIPVERPYELAPALKQIIGAT